MRVEVIKDFQYMNDKMQILVLPVGEVLEKQDSEFYRFKKRTSIYTVPVEIIENNPSFFKQVDWREDLLREMKKNKKSTTPAVHKQVVAYIENEVLFNKDVVDNDVMEEMLKIVREKYNVTSDKHYLDIFDRVGWGFDQDRIWKKY